MDHPPLPCDPPPAAKSLVKTDGTPAARQARMPNARWLPIVALLASSLCACAPESTFLDGTNEEAGAGGDALSEPVPVGSTLIATTDVNLRSGASTSNSILHVIPNGDSVTVVEATVQGGFYHVQHKGVTG